MNEKTKTSAEDRLSLAADRLCQSGRLKDRSSILSYLKSVSDEAFKKGVALVCGEREEKGEEDARN